MNRNLAGALAFLLFAPATNAAEGGSSSYLQGSYGDFAAGALGPTGVYLRNELIYYDASIPLTALGRPVDGQLSQALWGDLLKVAYISDAKILGGTYNANVAIPVLFGSEVTVFRPGMPPRTPDDDDVSGLGDIFFTPAALGWRFGNHHLNANLSFIAPTGEYVDERILNPGRNYWSLDPNVNYTWLDAKNGHELTATLGYMHNWENDEAGYTTGDEVHLDWLLAQYFSSSFAVGITGYFYDQVTDDSGAIPDGFNADDFDASGAGIGAAVMFTPQIAGRHVSFVGKWITDTDSDKRLDGDLFMLAVSLKL